VVLGYLNPRHLAGGSVRIEAERAHAALAQRVARPLGLGTSAAAWAAHVVCSARMIAGIKAVTTQRGRDPRESVLVAFGGNGPVHAAGMARLLGVRRVLVPPSPGLFSAFGLLFARHEHHVVRTFYRPMAELAPSELDAQVRTLEAEALAEMHADGYEPSRLRVARAADLRYVGQGFELTIPIEAGVLDAGKVARLLEDFRAEHLRTYGHRSEEGPVQLVNLRLTVLAGDEEQTRPGDPPGRAAPAASTRPVHFDGRDPVPCPVLERGGLAATPRPGPLIVEEYDATTVVPPGCTAALDGDGNIVLEIGEG
jgi:N-methylhydantoinase A